MFEIGDHRLVTHTILSRSCPLRLFLFSKIKKVLCGRRYKSQQALGSAMSQCLRGLPNSADRDAFYTRIYRLKLCIKRGMATDSEEILNSLQCISDYETKMSMSYNQLKERYKAQIL
jgi:hypothetical protein